MSGTLRRQFVAMKYGMLLIVMELLAVQAFGQVSTEEAAARLKEREANRSPATKPYDETVSLRKALADARVQADAMRQQNAQLKADLKKAQNPAAQEQAWQNAKPLPGMSADAITRIYDLNNWDRQPNKSTEIVGKTPLEIRVWSRPETPPPSSFRAVQVPQNLDTSDPRAPKPGQPETVIIVNDIVVYVSPK